MRENKVFTRQLVQPLLSKMQSLLFNLSTSPNITDLSIDYGGRYIQVYSFKAKMHLHFKMTILMIIF